MPPVNRPSSVAHKSRSPLRSSPKLPKVLEPVPCTKISIGADPSPVVGSTGAFLPNPASSGFNSPALSQRYNPGGCFRRLSIAHISALVPAQVTPSSAAVASLPAAVSPSFFSAASIILSGASPATSVKTLVISPPIASLKPPRAAVPSARSFSSRISPFGPSSSGRVRCNVSRSRAALVISVPPSLSSSTMISSAFASRCFSVTSSGAPRARALTSKLPVATRYELGRKGSSASACSLDRVVGRSSGGSVAGTSRPVSFRRMVESAMVAPYWFLISLTGRVAQPETASRARSALGYSIRSAPCACARPRCPRSVGFADTARRVGIPG